MTLLLTRFADRPPAIVANDDDEDPTLGLELDDDEPEPEYGDFWVDPDESFDE